MTHAVRQLGLFGFVNFHNPWRHEGYKTYAYENWLDLGRRSPDHQIHPIGTGGGDFRIVERLSGPAGIGLDTPAPRHHGTQPAACASVVTAYRNGADEAHSEGDPSLTIAEAIANNVPLDGGRRPLRVMRESGGQAVAVTDEEMRDGIHRLGQEGIFAEPAGASTVWAAKRLAEGGAIRPFETVVLFVTATGLKQPEALPLPQLPRIHATRDGLERIVKQWTI